MENNLQKGEYNIDNDEFIERICSFILKEIPDIEVSRVKPKIKHDKHKEYILKISNNQQEIGKLKELESQLNKDLDTKDKDLGNLEKEKKNLEADIRNKNDKLDKIVLQEKKYISDIDLYKKENRETMIK